tara:strand:- start:2707 stop:4749 length:2043 start_codon:yes stop_codon:yes gene_type:complete
MKILSLKLQNIRSYLDETIEFPDGSILLSGDIGSGKSTILLAIEFALFGMGRGEGNALLRQGKHEGSVELSFEIEGKEYTIVRRLKRGASVSQDTGYIIKDGIKKEGTTVELKSDILELLNYPKELLTKKNLVYRYTVYTPQEAMKQILLDNKEFRVDTLRKVFGVDKYRLIRENCDLISKELRDRIKILVAKSEHLPEKKKQVAQLRSEVVVCSEKMKQLEPLVVAAKDLLEKNQIELKSIQEQVQALQLKKQEYAKIDTQLQGKTELFQRHGQELAQLQQDVDSLSKELGGKVDVTISEQVAKLSQEAQLLEGKIFTFVKLINEATIKKNNAKEVQFKISKLDHCPTCEQVVSEDYKHKIQDRETAIIIDQDKNITTLLADQKQVQLQVDTKKGDVEKLREKEKEVMVLQHKQKQLVAAKQKLDHLTSARETLKQEVGALNGEKMELSKDLESSKEIEEKNRAIQSQVEKYSEAYHAEEIKVTAIQKEKEGIERMLASVLEDVGVMEGYLKDILRDRQKEEWLSKMFSKLMSTIEKHVMAKLYHEFNALFQDWFNVLIEDEALTVALDDEFGVEITQNGYQVDLEYMSGGEKTSCALAYRLSLNQIINDLIGEIKTKDILILDEPTDGFSSEQLDKIRDVLNELALEQIIIVSHERKIESFVDHVIQVRKEEHVSSAS